MQYLVEGVAEFNAGGLEPCCKIAEVSANTVGEAVSSASGEIGDKVVQECGACPIVRILTVFDEYGNQYAWVENGRPTVENAIRNSHDHPDAWKDHTHGHWELVV